MTLTIPSHLGFLALARAFVEAACLNRGLDEAGTSAVVLAANEALSNVVRHGHRDRTDAQVRIDCLSHPEGVEICLTDDGEPFNLAAVPDLDPAELRVGGRGIYLMRALMDELVCEPRAPRGNVLRMLKRSDGCGARPNGP